MKHFFITAAALGALLGTAPPSQAEPMSKTLSVETTPLKTLIANPLTRSILISSWPGIDNLRLVDVADQPLRALEGRPEAGLNEALLSDLQSKIDSAVSQLHSVPRAAASTSP